MTDMTEKIFESFGFGQAALKALGQVPENFRLYDAAWSNDRSSMTVTGAEFARDDRQGGQLCILQPSTTRTVIISAEDIAKQ